MFETIKAWQFFLDGRAFRGEVRAAQLPNLSLLIEQVRAGGMDVPVPVEVGMEAMGDLQLTCIGKRKELMGSVLKTGHVTVTLRASLEDEDGATKPVVIEVRGKGSAREPQALESGNIYEEQLTFKPAYYREELNGDVITEIDPANMIRIVDGSDQLEGRRKAIGL